LKVEVGTNGICLTTGSPSTPRCSGTRLTKPRPRGSRRSVDRHLRPARKGSGLRVRYDRPITEQVAGCLANYTGLKQQDYLGQRSDTCRQPCSQRADKYLLALDDVWSALENSSGRKFRVEPHRLGAVEPRHRKAHGSARLHHLRAMMKYQVRKTSIAVNVTKPHRQSIITMACIRAHVVPRRAHLF